MRGRRAVAGIVAAILTLATAAATVHAAIALTPNVGQHLHVEVANHPVDGFPIARAPYTFHVTIRLHDFPAGVQSIRIDDYDHIAATRTFSSALTCATADCAFAFDWTVDFGAWSVGRHELRWHADSKDADPATSGTQRQFSTSRVQVCVGSCSPNLSGRPANWHGGGSWYTNVGYVVALMTSPDTDLRPGGSVSIRSQYGSTACAYLNPAFHAGSHGQALGCGSSVAIPATAAPGDRFLVVATGSQEAGVFEARIGDGTPSPVAFFAAHSWWSKAGLVLP